MKAVNKKVAVGKNAPGTGSKKRLWAVAGLLVVLLLGTWYMTARGDPQLERVKELQQELFSSFGKDIPPEERKQQWETLKVEMEKLTPEQRVEARKELGRQGMQKMNESGAKYFAMSPVDRQKAIDEEIVKMEARRKAWQDWKAKAKANPNPNANAAGGQPAGGQPGQGGGPGPGVLIGPGGVFIGGPGKGGGPPGGPGGWADKSPEERDTMTREFILKTTPQARAGMDQKRLDMATRRAQLGLPPMQGRRP